MAKKETRKEGPRGEKKKKGVKRQLMMKKTVKKRATPIARAEMVSGGAGPRLTPAPKIKKAYRISEPLAPTPKPQKR